MDICITIHDKFSMCLIFEFCELFLTTNNNQITVIIINPLIFRVFFVFSHYTKIL